MYLASENNVKKKAPAPSARFVDNENWRSSAPTIKILISLSLILAKNFMSANMP